MLKVMDKDRIQMESSSGDGPSMFMLEDSMPMLQ